MSIKQIVLTAAALLSMAAPLAGQEVGGLELADSNSVAADDSEKLGQKENSSPAVTTPDVFVDLSDVPTGADATMSDPLSAEIERARATAGQWFRGMGMERWTKQPILAGLLSIGIVFSGFMLVRAFGKRSTRRVPGRLPRQVVELVGFTPLNSRQQLQLVRVGSKLVLVAVSMSGAEPLAEITDPVEVDQILAACHAGPSNLVAALTQWGSRNRPTHRDAATSGGRAARALFEA